MSGSRWLGDPPESGVPAFLLRKFARRAAANRSSFESFFSLMALKVPRAP